MRRVVSNAILGAISLATIGAGILAAIGAKGPSIVESLPRNTAIVIEVDLTELRKSARGRQLLEGGALGKAIEAQGSCARELGSKLEKIGVAISGFEDDVAIVAIGAQIRARDVQACAESVIRARGGAPSVLRDGSFVTVQDGDGSRGVLAVRDGGPVVVGHGLWLAAILDVADGEAPSLRDDAIHDRARRGQQGAVATLSYALPDVARGQLATTLPKPLQFLADVPSAIAAVRLDDAGLRVALDASCVGKTCVDLAAWLEGARDSIAKDPRATLLGVRADLEAATIVNVGSGVTIALTISAPRLDDAWSRLAGAASAIDPSALPSGHPSMEAVGPIPSASASR